ncbi:MAG: FixH family protein [Hyphomicrobiales bacterium]|nr:FixH family protein [Hyphomicrobiales bacterium]
MPTVLEAPKASGGRELKGWHVLAILLAFFGTVASVNFVMIRSALATFSGEVTKHPYEEGLAYNKQIAAATVQNGLGWVVDAHATRDAGGMAAVDYRVRDKSGAPVAGLDARLHFAWPTDMKRDKHVMLAETAPGVYTVREPLGAGAWDLEFSASRNGAIVFQSVNRVDLK